MTITEKRAELYKEWRLAVYDNDEDYYYSTLIMGIPDGDTLETVLADLQEGFYDKDIMDTINLYKWAKKEYGNAGWYIDKILYMSEAQALVEIERAEGKIPTKIYKNKIVY